MSSAMSKATPNTMLRATKAAAVLVTGIALFVTLGNPSALYGEKKKKDAAPAKQPSILEVIDTNQIYWPAPPAPMRVKYLNYFCCDKYVPPAENKKNSWMDRMAGSESVQQQQAEKPLFALWTPYGLAVDSKGNLYVADGKVGAIFIFNTETRELSMIKHGVQARFGDIIGLAIDDSDRLFVSDTKLHRILVFGKDHKLEGQIGQGVVDPGGMVVDNENRFLYVADGATDVVLVFDADKLTFIRKIGTPGKNHTLSDPGNFSYPTNVALDADNNLYVTDSFNNRVEIFDADGNFIRQFGKAGDRPGTLFRPKGIAIDVDGHVWVADAVQDRVQCFTQEGDLLMWLGNHGRLPGEFQSLAGLYIDKNNRIFTSEQYPGRVQMFRYFTDDEARKELANRRAELDKKKDNGAKASTSESAVPPAATSSAAKKPQ